jgi:hypothetical protein
MVDGGHWLSRFFEPFKLGMVTITLCLALQDLLGQQGFPPKGDQAFRVQQFRVEAPQAHNPLKQTLALNVFCLLNP